MQFDLEDVLKELKRREKMAQDIDAILEERFIFERRSKMRRGLVQDIIAQDLGVTKSSKLSTLINERMSLRGHEKFISSGNAFYRSLSLKKHNSAKN